ncbi:MAG: HAMP domain-containing histidine kinase [Chitinophagaceae bacterium]|nr:HAMP domain-containing histidine kinase [Chitinophagaceae bacterium]
MNRQRHSISILLMIIAIIAVISFQAYWLYKNYQEEKQNLRVQTNILFREAVYQCQAKKMNLDTLIKFRHASAGPIRVFTALQNRLRDTFLAKPSIDSRVIIARDKEVLEGTKDSFHVEIDSGQIRKLYTSSPGREKNVMQILETAEASHDSITTREIEEQYRKMLARENIQLPFSVSRFQGVRRDEFIPPDLEEANEVSIGLLKPITFRVNINDATGYIIRKMFPGILVSFLLIALMILSFLLLVRNLSRQRKLTQLKNDFISNITHELKTPIATVSVAIEAMKNFNALDDPQRTQEYLNISANELQRLSLLVDKVLRLSMFEKKEIEFKKESFDLLQLVKDVTDSMKLQFENQKASVTFESTGNNFIIEADKRHLTSVIYNLLDNALKYSYDDPRINIHIIDRSDFLEFRVCDNGIGIPLEYKNRIFEQFFRVPSGDRHNTKGYGLGLSYVNHIVRSHMGFIEVETEPGKGSTFIIKLPFAEAPVIYYDQNRRIMKQTFKL